MGFSRRVRLPTNVADWTNENEGAERLKILFIPTDDTLEVIEEKEKELKCSWKISSV